MNETVRSEHTGTGKKKGSTKEPTRTNDPARTTANILEVAIAEFSLKGLAGARIDEIAAENESQVVMVTHSEVILEEALDHNLTLLLGGKTDDIAAKSDPVLRCRRAGRVR